MNSHTPKQATARRATPPQSFTLNAVGCGRCAGEPRGRDSSGSSAPCASHGATARDYPIVNHVVHASRQQAALYAQRQHTHFSPHTLHGRAPPPHGLVRCSYHGNIITAMNSSENPPSWPHCPYHGNIITVMTASAITHHAQRRSRETAAAPLRAPHRAPSCSKRIRT